MKDMMRQIMTAKDERPPACQASHLSHQNDHPENLERSKFTRENPKYRCQLN